MHHYNPLNAKCPSNPNSLQKQREEQNSDSNPCTRQLYNLHIYLYTVYKILLSPSELNFTSSVAVPILKSHDPAGRKASVGKVRAEREARRRRGKDRAAGLGAAPAAAPAARHGRRRRRRRVGGAAV